MYEQEDIDFIAPAISDHHAALGTFVQFKDGIAVFADGMGCNINSFNPFTDKMIDYKEVK